MKPQTLTTTPNLNLLDVQYSDGTASRFEIKSLGITKLYQFAKHLITGDSFAAVVLATGQPPEMVDRLEPASFGMLCAESTTKLLPQVMILAKNDGSLAAELFPVLQRIVDTLGIKIPEQPATTEATPIETAVTA